MDENESVLQIKGSIPYFIHTYDLDNEALPVLAQVAENSDFLHKIFPSDASEGVDPRRHRAVSKNWDIAVS